MQYDCKEGEIKGWELSETILVSPTEILFKIGIWHYITRTGIQMKNEQDKLVKGKLGGLKIIFSVMQ